MVWSVLTTGALVAGCNKVPLLAPSQSTITLSTTNTIVQSNGTAQVSATVLEQPGTAVQNGTTVTFTTTLGTLAPTQARTVNGIATTTFSANGQSGVAEIRAISGGAKPADTANPSLKLTVGGAAASRILVTASPSRVSAGGSSTITATVSDANGNTLIGVTVAFTTDNGTVSNTVATTNSSGQAVTTLTTTRDATVTATAGASSGTSAVLGTVKVTVTTFPGLAIAVAGTAAPAQGQPTTLTVTVTPGTADPFQSIVVTFGDGTSSGNVGGSTTSVSHTYGSSGSFTVTATGTTVSGDSTSVSTIIAVAPRAPIGISVTAVPNPVLTHPGGTVFTVTFDGAAPSNVSGYDWVFGDGATDHTTGKSTQHVYAAAGTYTARVTVTTIDGNSGNATTQVVVQ